MKNDLPNTIAAYHAECARQQKIGDIFAALFVAAVSLPVLFAIGYALTR